MSIVSDLDMVRDWVQENICSEIKLKLPADTDNREYSYELVTPETFVLYLPSKDRLPPGALSPIPSVCIELLEGKEDATGLGTVDLRLVFSAWDPGIHGPDIFDPVEGKPGHFTGRYSKDSREFYRRCSEGWRDLWNFIDLALRKLESAGSVGGLALDRKAGIQYGMFSQDGALLDFYPYWHGWITLTLNRGTARKPEWNDLL